MNLRVPIEKALLLCAMLALGGCFDTTVAEIDAAYKVCEPHGGLSRIYANSWEALCKDGVEIKFRRILKQ